MQQGADHIFLVPAVAVGEGGRLQGMGQAIDWKTAEIAIQQFEVGEDAVGQQGGELDEVLGDDAPVVGCTVFHVGELGVSTHRVVSCLVLGAAEWAAPGKGSERLWTSVGVMPCAGSGVEGQLCILRSQAPRRRKPSGRQQRVASWRRSSR
jgi:hypothetical protein